MQYLDTSKLTEIFIECDDFLKGIEGFLATHSLPSEMKHQSKRSRKMNHSEMMTIIIYYHYSGFKCFKWYYNLVVRGILRSYFPQAYSYNRFVELQKKVIQPLAVYLKRHGLGKCSGISFIDSTAIKVCHYKREKQHQVFKGIAEKSYGTLG